MQTFQQYFYENKTILSHIMESRSGKWDIFIKFASSFEVLSFSIRFCAKFGRHQEGVMNLGLGTKEMTDDRLTRALRPS